jgi:O-antigen/teichoic acid export membrane protein
LNASYVTFSKQAVVSTLASASVYARTIVLVPVMARCFVPGDYGIWIQIYAAVELLVVIGSIGLQRSLIRFWHQSKDNDTLARDLSSILLVVAIACVMLGVIVTRAGDLVAGTLWDEPQASAHLDLLLLLLPLTAFTQIMLSAFRAERRVVAHSALLISESTGFVALTILLLSQGGGVREALLALTATRLAVFVIGYTMILRQIGWGLPSIAALRPFLSFSLPLVPVGTFMWVSNMSDRYVISHYLDTEAVAEYSIHYSVGGLIGLFFSPVFFILVPAITQLWEQGRKNTIQEYLMYAQKYPMLIIAPSIVLLTIHVDRVISLIATEAYSGSPVLILGVAAGITLLNMAALAENVICLVLKTRVIPVIYALSAGCNVALNLLLIPIWGIRGAALVTAATYGLQFAAMHWYARKFFGPFINWRIFLRIVVAALVMYVTAHITRDSFVASLVLSLGAYLMTLAATGCFERRELALLRAVFTRSTMDGSE